MLCSLQAQPEAEITAPCFLQTDKAGADKSKSEEISKLKVCCRPCNMPCCKGILATSGLSTCCVLIMGWSLQAIVGKYNVKEADLEGVQS